MEYFDLKMLDDKYSEHNFPMLSIGMTKTPKIEVELTSHDWFTIGQSYDNVLLIKGEARSLAKHWSM